MRSKNKLNRESNEQYCVRDGIKQITNEQKWMRHKPSNDDASLATNRCP
jgi:hypothetical protein